MNDELTQLLIFVSVGLIFILTLFFGIVWLKEDPRCPGDEILRYYIIHDNIVHRECDDTCWLISGGRYLYVECP